MLYAGIAASLDGLVKEFVSADDDKKKVVFSRLGEEVYTLKGSAARFD